MHTDVEHGEEQGETAGTENNFGGGKRGRALIATQGAASPRPPRLGRGATCGTCGPAEPGCAGLRGAARGRGAEPPAGPQRRSSMLPSPRV